MLKRQCVSTAHAPTVGRHREKEKILQMRIEYIPNNGFEIDTEKFSWNEGRASVRNKLQNQHKGGDIMIEMSDFFGGDKSHNIKQRRDVYRDINSQKNYFFVNYDKDDNLSELEIHWGVEIVVKGIQLKFEKDINIFLQEFEKIGERYTKIDDGNYLFGNLKMTIANSESMGGEGNELSYFYVAKDIITKK